MKYQLLVPTAITTTALAAMLTHYTDWTGTNFSDGGNGTHYGSSFVTTYNGHSDLQLVSDGQPGTYGTWQGEDFPGRHIVAFDATFKWSFKNDGGPGDGFSFLFGDMTDMSGNQWEGGEHGLNRFTTMGSGMSIGFDSYGGDSGVYARWGGQSVTWTNFGNEWYNIGTYTDYGQALDDYYQGTVTVIWNIATGLQVGIAWPAHETWWGIDTGLFTGSIMDTTDFSFGFAARNGGIDMDVLIDEFNVTYTYFLDCNGNDIDDTLDIKSGVAQDCNGNGIPDACDIANGGDDANNNGTPDECECLGDVQGDDTNVDIEDLLVLIKYWGSEGGPADINADGIVDIADLLILVANWGPCN